MEPLLFLAHRIPYPPDKGDKIRSFHLLRHLAARHRVFLGTFVDDPADRRHVAALQALCADVCALPLAPRRRRIASLAGFATGEALTLPYYRSAALQRWVDATVAREGIRRGFVFSAAMAQYVLAHAGMRRVLDLVDVDSEKWRQYAAGRRGPAAWVYRREADRLLRFEAAAAGAFDASLLVTAAEKALFAARAPGAAARVHVVANGVDGAHFAPDAALPRPFARDELPVVFTGAMDYWPNVDAACWFASAVLPAVLRAHPRARFHVVGMNPLPAVQALARDPAVAVTGRVPDTRPYLQHAAVVVAPLRIARGVQNKVLEAMAMQRPVVASAECAAALTAVPGAELLVAANAGEFAAHVSRTLAGERPGLGEAARARVLGDYPWTRSLELVARLVDGAAAPAPAGAGRPTGALRAA
ncbi:MAG: TIGR03087 family PEP-CTERM/XrtA system glycosyltransferase [Burkholderiales bacterium]